MAEGRGGGPHGGGSRDDSPPRDSDGYDWLYAPGGSAGRAPADDQPTQQWGARGGTDPGTEATQVVPTYGRTQDRTSDGYGGPPPTRIEPTPGGRGAPPGGSRRPPGAPTGPVSARPKSRPRRRFRLRWLWLLLLAYLAFLVAVPVYAWTSVSRVDATPARDRPDDQPGTTYLLVGSDARAGLAGQRTDTIMLLHT